MALDTGILAGATALTKISYPGLVGSLISQQKMAATQYLFINFHINNFQFLDIFN